MKIRFKKLTENAVIPTKAHPTDAGFDLVATSKVQEEYAIAYGTGIAVEIPKGYVGLIFPRSSVVKTCLSLSNCVGVIDSGYRGEIKVKFYCSEYIHRIAKAYNVGDRIAQLIILPYPDVQFVESFELSDSDRGTGGFGSTGE